MASGSRKGTKKTKGQTIFWDKQNFNYIQPLVTRTVKQEDDGQRGSELSERELRLGRATWTKHVDSHPTEFRQMVFDELFRCHPDYQLYFMKMMDNTGRTSSVYSHSTSKSHMYDRIIPKLKEIFDNLDEPAVLDGIMTKLGLYHAKMRLNRKHMTDMIKVLISCVDKMTGYKLQKDEEHALDKCLSKAFSIAIDSMEQWAKNNPEGVASRDSLTTIKATFPNRTALKRVEPRTG